MQYLYRLLAIIGLVLVVSAAIIFAGEVTKPPLHNSLIMAGTVAWFLFSYAGFGRNTEAALVEDEA